MDISVVIPVRHDPLLPRAVASVPEGVSLIIAMTDPAPEDRAVAESLVAGRPGSRLAVSPKRGMAAGVNLGVGTVSTPKVAILDSDCTLRLGSLEAYSAALEEAPFARGQTLVEALGPWSRMAALGTQRLNRVFASKARLFGPSIAFRKEAFLSLGGYDEEMVAGSCDHEFALRVEDAGLEVAFVPEAVVVHQPITFRIDTRSHRGYGRGMAYLDRKRGGDYGLKYCKARLDPRELWTKAKERGLPSVARSIILGLIMLRGYREESRS